MTTAGRTHHRTTLDVVWITPQERCVPSAITRDAMMAAVIVGSRQTISTRVMRLYIARDLARPARDFTASRHSHGIQYP
jgi:hypothetical protein